MPLGWSDWWMCRWGSGLDYPDSSPALACMALEPSLSASIKLGGRVQMFQNKTWDDTNRIPRSFHQRSGSNLSHWEEVEIKNSSGTGKVHPETAGYSGTSTKCGSNNTPWQKATNAKRLVIEKVRHQEEVNRCSRAVTQAKKGCWMRWDGVDRKMITLCEL